MKIVITGASGFIGGHLVDHLLDLGHKVVGIDDFSSGTYQREEVKYFPWDISRTSIQDLRNAIKGSDVVIHLAAKARVQPSFLDPIRYNEVNVTGTLNILEACRLEGIINFVFASSSSVYGVEPMEGGSCETDYLFPQSPYALQKKIGEEYCNLYSQFYQMNIKILRFFNVYGDRMITSGQYQQAIRIFLDNYLKREPFLIFGNGDQRRDFTHVSDIVKGISLVMNENYSVTLNLGHGENYSINELCVLIAGNNYPRNHTLPKKEPLITLANNNLARSLGWNPKIKLRNWIREQI